MQLGEENERAEELWRETERERERGDPSGRMRKERDGMIGRSESLRFPPFLITVFVVLCRLNDTILFPPLEQTIVSPFADRSMKR